MDKYYTPSIEEFHVGFEFEVNYTGEGWLKEIFCNGTGKNIDSIGKLKSFLGKTTFEDAYRVKYLDKKDIESLGFEFIEKNGDLLFKSIKTYRGLSTGDDSKIWISYYPKNQWTLIYKRSNRGEEDDLFYGVIKNKSELKKILKQLNVKE